MKLKYCGLAAIIAVAALLIFSGMYFSQVSASYTPANPIIASWDVATDIPKNISTNGTWTKDTSDDYTNGIIYYSTAQDAALRWSVNFPDTAPHTLYIRANTDTNKGAITVSIDFQNQTNTIDTYAATGLKNQVFSTQITPARIGRNSMQFWMATKNGASSGYNLELIDWWII